MTGKRKTAVVICPGRGSYNKSELGYLQQHHSDKAELLQAFDQYRSQQGQPTLSELDCANQYDRQWMSRGDNASSLIYACAYADFLSIDTSRFEIVAVTGNSMGWYIALACAGALNPLDALQLINHMGTLMHTQQRGGQLIYPMLDENWQRQPRLETEIKAMQARINSQPDCELYTSIKLGGMRVFAGNEAGLKALSESLPGIPPYPMRLPAHGAFHSPLMQGISDQARQQLSATLFQQAELALLDGRGNSWFPAASTPSELWDYTLGEQITHTYDFSSAVQNSAREFAPDCFINLGPGNSLGAVTAQALIDINWQGLASKQDFSARQASDPIILSMGLSEQRQLVVKRSGVGPG